MIRSLLPTLTVLFLSAAPHLHAEKKPNFIIIFADDQGYQDLGSYNAPDFETPHLDQMAKEGMKFTSFYAQTVCGAPTLAPSNPCPKAHKSIRNIKPLANNPRP